MRLKLLCGVVAVFLLPSTPVKGQFDVPSRLTLEEARRLLLQYNPTIKAASARTESEKADVTSASQRPNPELALSSEGIDFQSNSSPFFDAQEISVNLRYRIETSQKREKRTRLQRLEADISEIEVADITRRLLFELSRKYFQVVLAQENLQLAHTMLEDFRAILRLNRIRYEEGEISGGELRRTEAEQYRFLEDVMATEVDLENAQDHLISLLGKDRFGENFTAIDTLRKVIPQFSGAELREAALASRSDLKIARAEVVHSDNEIALEEAHATPDITPFIGYRRDFGANGLIAGFRLPLPLFDRNEGGIERSVSRRRERQWRLREEQITVLKEVQLAFNELRGNRRRVELLESEYLEKSRQARDIAESAYRLGGISLIEFLDAQRSYREATRLLNRALHDLRVSLAHLELAVGREL